MLATERNSVFPDIPTTVELGYPDVVLPIYYFFAFPKGTPKEIVDKFAAACEQISKDAGYQAEILKTYQQSPYFKRGDEALTILKEQQAMILKYSDDLRK
jgi:tripartite-type tricarboxylate transporter receptor subunit TctC